jgi:hypothetical protein
MYVSGRMLIRRAGDLGLNRRDTGLVMGQGVI